MTAPARLFGIQKADGSISQDPDDLTREREDDSDIEVEIVRTGTVAELTRERDKYLDALVSMNARDERQDAAIVARLEEIIDRSDEGVLDCAFATNNALHTLLSDLKAGRVEGKT